MTDFIHLDTDKKAKDIISLLSRRGIDTYGMIDDPMILRDRIGERVTVIMECEDCFLTLQSLLIVSERVKCSCGDPSHDCSSIILKV